jgi:SPP1 gp7 family putative phage head morphogenesis protein
MEAPLMAEPYGTIAKYRNALAIKKHNAIIQPWASAMALDVAAVFWATWKGIEERLPEGDEIIEAEKPRDSRDLKNKYSAIIRVEVKRHSAELQRVIENYIYRVWLAGAVEQCRDLGCTGWFFSSLSKSSTSSESASAPDGASLQEAPRVRNVKADKSGWVSLPNLRAQEYAKKHAAEAVTQINDTTRKEIARIVSDGVKSGSSYNDIAKAIKDKFEEFAVPMPQKHVSNRAVLVAVTELANAYCEGNAQVGNYLQDNGVKMMKAWQTLEDDRVSDGCKENERVGWIPIKKEFPSGHMHPPRFPGCRCDFLQDILEEDMLGKPIEALYGKQYTNSAVNITKSSPSKTVSSQVQQVIPSKKTKVGKTASKRVDKSGAPKWDAWDLRGVEEKINSLRPKDYYIAMDAFEKGNVSEFASRAGEKIPEVVKLLSDKKKSFSSMPEPMKDSINTYTGSYYLQMNEYLKKGRKVNSLFSDRKVKINVENAEKAIKKYGVTSCPIVVNRGFDGDFWDSWEEGEIKQIPEFVSTSVKSTGFRRDNTAHIYVPPNRGCGIYVDGESKNPREWEYLIAPDSKFKVHHIEDNEWGGKDFWLELIP